MNSLEEIEFDCPHCGERQQAMVDISAGNQQYIEDCQICCSPILFDIELGGRGEFKNIIIRREND